MGRSSNLLVYFTAAAMLSWTVAEGRHPFIAPDLHGHERAPAGDRKIR